MASMTKSITALFFFFIFRFTTVVNSGLHQSDPEDCAGRRIHVRSLPPEFNLHLLSASSPVYHPLSPDISPYLPNHGLGPKAHNATRSWFRTHPSLLELLFHRRILEYPCLTPHPRLSDAVFLPYYAGLDSLNYLYHHHHNFTTSQQHGLPLFHFLKNNSPEIWHRNLGHDHFLVASRPAWDFSHPLSNDPPLWGTSFLELPEFFNVTVLTLESRAYPWQEVAIPYPTSFHPPNTASLESWLGRVRRSRRTTLMLFAGENDLATPQIYSASPNIRRSIRIECDNSSSRLCEFVDCSEGVCEHDPVRFTRAMLQASFCLQPPGDTPTRRSTFDGIVAGCIPVFFEEQSARRQYRWHLPEERYGEFSVFIPKEDVVFKGVRILDVLMRIPRGEVRRMRERVIELIPRVIYRKHGSTLGLRSKKDAFDIAVEGTLEGIKYRLQEVSGHA